MEDRSHRILVIDDTATCRTALTAPLRRAGYEVYTGSSASEVQRLVLRHQPDLLIIDVVLPDGSGIDLCRCLRQDPATARLPVILVSANRIEADDQSEGIESGADDYLLKPVPSRLLLAKVESVLRRFSVAAESKAVLNKFGLSLDVQSRRVHVKGREVRLTRKEFDLLVSFLQSKGRVLTPASLLESVWGHDLAAHNDTHTVEVHISTLRNKLGRPFADRLSTVIGCGYRLD